MYVYKCNENMLYKMELRRLFTNIIATFYDTVASVYGGCISLLVISFIIFAVMAVDADTYYHY